MADKTEEREWYYDLPKEDFLRVLGHRLTDSGRYEWRAATPPLGGLGELFHLVLAGVSIAVIVLSTMIFALMDAEWSFWHWVTLGVLAGPPTLLTLAGLVLVASSQVTEYRRYKKMLAYAGTRGWKP